MLGGGTKILKQVKLSYQKLGETEEKQNLWTRCKYSEKDSGAKWHHKTGIELKE